MTTISQLDAAKERLRAAEAHLMLCLIAQSADPNSELWHVEVEEARSKHAAAAKALTAALQEL